MPPNWLPNIASDKQYQSGYDSALLRGEDNPFTPRPWNLTQKIKAVSSKEKVLLDIGCGTCFKLLPLAVVFGDIYGIDPSQDMLDIALTKRKDNRASNIHLIKGIGQELPFANATFDVITCMLSRWDIIEIHRVLKPNGHLFIEHIGPEDKKEFKMFFGKDDKGWRGQYLGCESEIFIEKYRSYIALYFEKVEIKNGYWETFYTKEGLMQLLKYTPIVRSYSFEKDSMALKTAVEKLQTDQGIKLIQNRIFIRAMKPRDIL